MKKNSIFLLIILFFWITLGTFLCWKYLCTNQEVVGDIPQETTDSIETNTNISSTAIALSPWRFNDGDNVSVESEEYIQFYKDNSEHLSIKNNGLVDELLKTINYLNENPKRNMTIIGYYKGSEVNNSIFPNLGLARADNVKEYLKTMGASSKQLSTSTELMTEDWFDGNILKKGIDIQFSEVTDNSDKLREIRDRIKVNPITLYFETNAKSINLNEKQRQDFADLIYYLDNVDKSKLIISGHTDNVDKAEQNKSLSRKRARFVKQYLKENGGILKDRSSIRGYGDDRPIAPNSDEEGRTQNRRVEVTLK
ncbi:MAG: OOP family OmpA-OmpF porin [Maribacter sp.]|jgi:OOP family OmpA-OmpF porin